MGAMEGECYFYDFYDFGGGLLTLLLTHVSHRMGAMEGECYFYDFYDFGGGLGSMIRHAPELEEITVLPETPVSPLNTTTTTNTNFNFELSEGDGGRSVLTPDMIRIEYPQLPLAVEDASALMKVSVRVELICAIVWPINQCGGWRRSQSDLFNQPATAPVSLTVA
ncbi:hypothetical protein Bbelb_223850 [Branchiostoma belcheri]|nr:hypothetical protein Bbelb_223850 [Branchiostoma belcheri]